METLSDKLALMELELQFLDDTTSCSSSTFSICEDFDDLRLGADANTFTTKYEEEINDRPVQKFEIMKEQKNSLGQNDYNYTVSTISSISDLIDAREGDPEDMLLGLGFISFEGEESRSSILSRFSSPPRNEEIDLHHNQQYEQHHSNNYNIAIGPTVHNGIIKTQEWLANQDDNISGDSVTSSSKDSSTGSNNKVNGQGQAKRISSQKKRHRWSKSRQSSFEHLLPNLEEETGIDEPAEKSDSSSASLKDKHIPPIRESSQEKENYSPNKDKLFSAKDLGNKDLYQKLTKLERQKSYEKETELLVFTDLCTTSPQNNRVIINQIHSDDKQLDGFAEMEKSVLTESSPSPVRLSPWKQLGRKNLLNNMMKVDSFELEEIVSNDGRLSPDVSTLPQKVRSVGVKVTNPFKDQNNVSTKPSQHSNTLQLSEEDSSSASHSDTSSGFEEESEDINFSVSTICECSGENCEQMESLGEDSTCKSTQQSFVKHMNATTVSKSSELLSQKVHDFCSSRSRMACASGVAEYALRFRKLQLQANNLRAASCSDIQHLESRFGEKIASSGTETMDSECQCECDFNSSLSLSERTKSMSCTANESYCSRNKFSGHRKRVQTLSNVNNNNSKHHKLPSDTSKLLRYSSMPTLSLSACSTTLSSYRKISCQSYFPNPVRNAGSTTDSSLMSSISDVMYLSYKTSPRGPKDYNRKMNLVGSKVSRNKTKGSITVNSKFLNSLPNSFYSDGNLHLLSSNRSHLLCNGDVADSCFCHNVSNGASCGLNNNNLKSSQFNHSNDNKPTNR